MDWTSILAAIEAAGVAAAPVVASILMAIIGAVFAQLVGHLPGFVRAYVERAYREREAIMADAIRKALVNGLKAALKRGASGPDALQEAIDHALRTTPESIAHFERTSGMDRQSLLTMAEGAAFDERIKLDAETVAIPVAGSVS